MPKLLALTVLGHLLSAAAPAAAPPGQDEDASPDRVEVGDSGLLDLRFRGVDIVIALEMISEQTQRNIVVHDGVSGPVSLVLRKVSFEQALETVLAVRGLTYVERANVIHVFADTQQKAADGVEARIFRLSYVMPSEAETFIKPLLSPDGTVSKTADPQIGIKPDKENVGGMSSTGPDVLIVVDHPVNLDWVGRALREIDVRPKQVLVEATIMRATLNEQNALGIDFNTLYGVDFTIMGAVSPGLTDVRIGNLPSRYIDDSTSTLRTDFTDQVPGGGLTFGIVKDQVAGFIRALEQLTDVTIVANPKLLTLNKQRGEVIVGRRDGYLTTTVTETAAVQTVEFLETGTKLVFRPFVIDDGNVRMEIHPEDSNGGLTAANLPFQETTEATVNILLKDGHSILIGGLFRERTTVAESQVPIVGNIPVLGRLFGVDSDQTIREEVVILLTIHVLDGPEATDEMADAAAEDIERMRVGARRGLMGTGREQIAEARYRHALEHLRNGEIEKALSSARLAVHMNPRNNDAIRLEERLLSERAWRSDGAFIRSYIHELLRKEAGLPPQPRFGRPDVDALLDRMLVEPEPEPAADTEAPDDATDDDDATTDD